MSESTRQPQDGDQLYGRPRHYPGAAVPVPPTIVPYLLVFTEQALETVIGWIDDEPHNRQSLLRGLTTLARMGGRGYRESENLIVFETPHLQVGLFRDPTSGLVSLHS